MALSEAAPQIPPTLAGLAEPIESLQPRARNPRRGDRQAIRESLLAHGQYKPIVANRRDGAREILVGNHTYLEARELGWPEIAVSWVDVDEERAARIVLVDNRTSDLAGYDESLLAELLQELPDLEATGWQPYDLDSLVASLQGGNQRAGGLIEKFGIPPFSILDARGGAWQERKRAWLALGIEAELGRTPDLLRLAPAIARKAKYAGVYHRRGYDAARAQAKDKGVYHGRKQGSEPGLFSGTSLFDPVLCELAVRWFSPPGGRVLDPFAGGPVRGIVAARLGRDYLGIDLRPEQIEANRRQGELLAQPGGAEWVQGDARDIERLAPGEFDLIFSCPPYFDLERYSDDRRDLSRAGSWADFQAAHAEIICSAAERLRPDRFAVWVVSEIRDSDGNCRGLLPAAISAFERAGLRFYNEAVLAQALGSVPIRAGVHFSDSRKLERCHQSVLVFVKGSGRAAAQACGEVEMGELELREAAADGPASPGPKGPAGPQGPARKGRKGR